jgi:hypothetical protein
MSCLGIINRQCMNKVHSVYRMAAPYGIKVRSCCGEGRPSLHSVARSYKECRLAFQAVALHATQGPCHTMLPMRLSQLRIPYHALLGVRPFHVLRILRRVAPPPILHHTLQGIQLSRVLQMLRPVTPRTNNLCTNVLHASEELHSPMIPIPLSNCIIFLHSRQLANLCSTPLVIIGLEPFHLRRDNRKPPVQRQ